MLITKPFISPEDKLRTDLDKSGIAKCSRKLIFFVDKTEYLAGTCKFAKAIQINLCVETGTISDSMKAFGLTTKNSSLLKNSVYKYDVVFPFGCGDLRSAVLLLKDAYSVEEINEFDNRLAYKNDIGTYNKDVAQVDGNAELLESANGYNRTEIPLPIYYNNTQQYLNEGENFSIIWLNNSISYDAADLIDQYTVLEVHESKTYDSLLPVLMQELQIKSSNKSDINNVNMISDCFVVTSETMLNGYSFIYDSQLGINVKTIPGVTSVPYSGFRIKENLAANLSMLKDFVVAEAKLIESKYGNICLYYVPLMSGDKLKIKYLDYNENNQPDFNHTKIDKGFTIEENILDEFQSIKRSYTDEGAAF